MSGRQSRGWTQPALVLGGALMILGLIAASSPAAQRDLTYLEGTDITTLEPARSSSNTDAAVLYLLYEGLTWMDPSGTLQPGLASSWTVSPDGLSWRFVLAGGSRFSDGTALTARDVKFSVERLTDAQSTFRSSFSALKGVEAPDDKTVIITTGSPFPDLPVLLATRGALIAQKAALEKWGKDFSEHPVGSGPYMLKEFVSGDRLELVPNPHYAGAQKARAARIIRRVVPEGLARVAGLLRGEGDLALNLPPEAVASVPPTAPIEIRKQLAALGVSFEMNVLKPHLSDRRVRQALNMAVDREAIIKNILLGNGTVQDSPASPGILGRVKTGPYPYDPAKARELLKAAGVPSDWKLVLWAAPGRYLKDRQVVEAVQGYLRAVGIDAELKLSEWVAYNTEFHKDPTTSPKQLYFVGRASPTMDNHLTRLFHTSSAKGGGGGNSGGGYSNQQLDRLIEDARVSFDAQKRAADYSRAQRLVWDDAPFLWLHYEANIFGHRKGLEGVTVRPNQELILNGIDWR